MHALLLEQANVMQIHIGVLYVTEKYCPVII